MDFNYESVNDASNTYGFIQLIPNVRIVFDVQDKEKAGETDLTVRLKYAYNPMHARHWNTLDVIRYNNIDTLKLESYDTRKFKHPEYLKITFGFSRAQNGLHIEVIGYIDDAAAWDDPNFYTEKKVLIANELIINAFDLAVLEKRAKRHKELYEEAM